MKNKAYIIRLLCAVTALFAAFALSASAAPLGDVDSDGNVSAADARLALRAAVGLEHYATGSVQFIGADVDKNGSITAADARLILRASVGLENLGETAHVHSYGAWTKETKANGTATGNHYRVCVCGDKQTAACTFGAKQYTSSNTTATCTKGTEFYTECTVCKGRKGGGEPALGHKYVTKARVEATCTVDGSKTSKCSRCGDTKTEVLKAPGHRCKDSNFSLNGDIYCSICHEKVFASFNTIVNGIKDGSYTFTAFEHNVTSPKINKSDITWGTPIFAVMLGDEFETMMAESFAKSDESYSNVKTGFTASSANYPILGSGDVSRLTDSDVVSFTVTPMKAVDFVKEFPDSIKIRSSSDKWINYSLASFKNAAAHNVNKVEIVIPTEKYSTFKTNSTETALMRACGSDIRQLVNALPDGAIEEDGMKATSNLKDLATDMTLTYYFDADNANEPLAAVYALNIRIDESMDMDCTIDFGEEGIEIGSLKLKGTINIMKGTIDMTMNTSTTSYYFFQGYFE